MNQNRNVVWPKKNDRSQRETRFPTRDKRPPHTGHEPRHTGKLNSILRRNRFLKSACQTVLTTGLLWLFAMPTTLAQTWSTYRHDNRRSGVSDATLPMPLTQHWVWKSPHVPQMAWTGPAKWDAWAGNRGLQSMRNFDPCFFVTADAEHVYFGSSVDDAAHALKVADGTEAWVHFTGAAVRMPPSIANGKVYFGSDDGKAYCCDAQSGDLIWQRKTNQQDQRITSNGKIISLWPVRTGVLIHGDRATFAGSLVPWEKSYFFSVDANNGSIDAENCYVREFDDVTLQGALLASEQRIYVPQGRAAPLAIESSNGKLRGTVSGAGGVFCVLSPEEQLIAGPSNQKSADDQIRVAEPQSNKALVSFNGTNRILIDQQDAFLVAQGKLRKLNRQQYVAGQIEVAEAKAMIKADPKKATEGRTRIAAAEKMIENSWGWTAESEIPLDIIKVGNLLILGLTGEVRALQASDGQELWRTEVEGAAHGLAAAAGKLFVSTDRGYIYAFGDSKTSPN
jgi:hypothetical protein